jgi:arylsulfatase A-like enzyme
LSLGLLFLAAGCMRGGGEIERVVVVTFDTTRADRLGCYGYEAAETPNLDRLARESVLFEQALAPVPTTLPSHSTMFTGLYPQDHGVRYNLMFTLGPQAVTLAEVLRGTGFETAAFPASYVVGSKFGLDQGFDLYVEPPAPDPRGKAGAAGHVGLARSATEGVDDALEWLAGRAGKVFVWLHFYDPHWPYTPPFPYSSRFREEPYDGEIAYTDAQFGRFVTALREDPAWSRTLLVVAGDHGEGLYDHEERFHANLVYQTTQRVPLIIHAPGHGARRVEESVGLVDIMPTVLDYLGLPAPGVQRGTSLRAAMSGGRLERRDLYFESHAGALSYGWDTLEGVRYGRWKLIDSNDPELFDLDEDPDERTNLIALEPDRVQELRGVLDNLRPSLLDESQAVEAQNALLDPETEAFLASLGYVGSVGSGSAEDAPQPRRMIDLEPELLRAQAAVALRDYPTMEEFSRYVLTRDPTNKWALQTLSTTLLATERPREAQDTAAEILKIYPDLARGYTLMAEAYSAQGEPATAYEVLQRGIEVLPGNPQLHYLALVAAFEAARGDVCTIGVPLAHSEFPGFVPILVLRARCQAIAGDLDGAIGTLRMAIARGFRSLHLLDEATTDFDELVRLEAFQELLRSLEEEPDDPTAS